MGGQQDGLVGVIAADSRRWGHRASVQGSIVPSPAHPAAEDPIPHSSRVGPVLHPPARSAPPSRRPLPCQWVQTPPPPWRLGRVHTVHAGLTTTTTDEGRNNDQPALRRRRRRQKARPARPDKLDPSRSSISCACPISPARTIKHMMASCCVSAPTPPSRPTPPLADGTAGQQVVISGQPPRQLVDCPVDAALRRRRTHMAGRKGLESSQEWVVPAGEQTGAHRSPLPLSLSRRRQRTHR